MEIVGAPIADQVKAAREKLDAHVREMVDWHFNPHTGCPFWLAFAEGLDFDPRKEIGGFDSILSMG